MQITGEMDILNFDGWGIAIPSYILWPDNIITLIDIPPGIQISSSNKKNTRHIDLRGIGETFSVYNPQVGHNL
jgi:hypothetical protein